MLFLFFVILAMPTCGAYIALFVVACIRGYNYTVTVFSSIKLIIFLSLINVLLHNQKPM